MPELKKSGNKISHNSHDHSPFNRSLIKKISDILLYVFVCGVGVLNVFSPTILSGFRKMQQDTGDPLFNAYVLEHIYKAFFDGTYTAPLFSPRFFYPAPNLLFFSDNLLGSAPIYWFFRQFFDWSLSFQLWEIVILVLTYFSFVWLFRYLKVRPVLSALASFILAFGITRVMQVLHPQIYPQFYTGAAFVFLLRFLKKPNFKDFNIFALLVFLQGTAGFYLIWFLVLSLSLLVLVLPVFMRDFFKEVIYFASKNSRRFIISVCLWAAAFVVFWLPYIIVSFYYRDLRIGDYVISNLGGIYSWVYVPDSNFWGPLFWAVPEIKVATWEQYAFPGMLIYFLTFLVFLLMFFTSKFHKLFAKLKGLFGFVENRDFNTGLIKTFFTVFLLMSLLSLRVGNFTLWRYLYHVFPGADGVRFAARIWTVSYIYWLIACFLVFEIVLRNLSKVNKRLVSFLLVFILIFGIAEQLVFEKKYFYRHRVLNEINLISTLLQKEDCDVSYLETGEGWALYIEQHILMMFAGLQTDRAVINGYTGTPTYKINEKLTKQQVIEYLESYDFNLEGDQKVCLISTDKDKHTYFVKEVL